MKHTKGKWEIFRSCIYTDVNKGILNYMYGRIAELFGKPEEIEANAKLIAQSPIMFDYIQEKANNGCKKAKEIVANVLNN